MIPRTLWELADKFPHDCMVEESTESTMALLYGLVRFTRPEVVVECGTNTGTSTVWLVQAVVDNGTGHVFSYETKTDRYEKAASLVGSVFGGHPPCTLINEAAQCGSVNRIDFCFLDIDPKSYYRNLYDDFLSSRMPVGSMLCAHDLCLGSGGESVKSFVDSLSGDWETIEMTQERGMSVSIRRSTR